MVSMPAKTAESSPVYRILVSQNTGNDPRSAAFLADAHAMGIQQVESIQCSDLYFLKGNLSQAELQKLNQEVLHDPVTQALQSSTYSSAQSGESIPNTSIVDVCLRPGVTDAVAEQILRAAEILGIPKPEAVSTGQRFVIQGKDLTPELLHTLAARVLCNSVIQRYALGPIQPSFPTPAEASMEVERIRIRGLNDEQLLALSQDRRAALNLEEMQAIQAYCQKEERDLTDIEFEMIAQTWSEHCVHKTFKSRVTVVDEAGNTLQVIDNLFNRTIREATKTINAPWVRSAFVDNAGIVDYDGKHELSFKVETHNHPSAIEPFGGANTGTGGVIRDVVGVSARPIASTDILCFGPSDLEFADLPSGVLHPRRIASGVVSGIQDYGNKIGLPTVNGAIWYDPGYTSNPLVYCGCAGIAPLDSHPREPQAGDRAVVIGGRTGRDGLRGATFSSMIMDTQTSEVAGTSVQIGAPIAEKGVIDVVLAARDRKLYSAITDCGAGGLSSAVGEMASGCGAVVELQHVPLKYPGLAPWEIWLSEAQERMVLAVPPHSLPDLQALCDLYEVELTDLGAFNDSGRTQVQMQGKTILDLDNHFLHKGVPQRQLTALLPQPANATGSKGSPISTDADFGETLINLLAHPNIASKENVVRVYDHEVQGATVIKPLTGVKYDGPSDGCMLRPLETQGDFALVLSAGLNPEYGKTDPAGMTANAIDEAIRNAVATGADPDCLSILDNFCWGDPNQPENLGDLVASALACRDYAVAYGTPFISGKDSFNNEYLGTDGKRHAIPPTLLISAMGVVPDWRRGLTMDLKQPDSLLYLIGAFEPVLGGSHWSLLQGESSEDGVPQVDASENLRHYRAIFQAAQKGLISAAHDLSEGGLAVSLAEMCIGGRLGAHIDLHSPDPLRACFGESSGCLLVEVDSKHQTAFEAGFSGLRCQYLGKTTAEAQLQISNDGQAIINLPVKALLHAWQGKKEEVAA